MSNYDKVLDILLRENWVGHYDPEKEIICCYGVEKPEHGQIKKLINKITKNYSYVILTKDDFSNVNILNIE